MGSPRMDLLVQQLGNRRLGTQSSLDNTTPKTHADRCTWAKQRAVVYVTISRLSIRREQQHTTLWHHCTIRPIACVALFIVYYLHWSLIIGVVNCCKRMTCLLNSAGTINNIACYGFFSMSEMYYKPAYETKRQRLMTVYGSQHRFRFRFTHIVQLGHHGSTSTHLKLEQIKDLFWVPQRLHDVLDHF